jgi:hypothetical protein
VEGGCKSGAGGGSMTAVSGVGPPFNWGDSRAGASSAFTLVFLVETLGINQISELFTVSIADGPWRVMKCSQALDGPRPEKFKMDLSIRRSRPLGLHYGKGNFTVNSTPLWRTSAAVSNPFLTQISRMITKPLFRPFERMQIGTNRPSFFLCDFRPGGCYKLNMTPDSELLGRYARTRSEDAFAELMRRHVNQ